MRYFPSVPVNGCNRERKGRELLFYSSNVAIVKSLREHPFMPVKRVLVKEDRLADVLEELICIIHREEIVLARRNV